MAVTISMQGDSTGGHVAFEDDDPRYWYLFPYFEQIHRETGQMVDLYDNAEFHVELLLEVFVILQKAEKDVRREPAEWTVIVGYRDPGRFPIETVVAKSAVLDCLNALMTMLNDAYNLGQRVVCKGD